MSLQAVLFDLGDVIMQEATEQKIDDVTHQADLHPGMAKLLRRLHESGMPLGLVADTRIGTYRNVLGMHGLLELFDVFAISEEVGVEKPDRRMFEHALNGLGLPANQWSNVAMVGNNLSRDILGANALGLTTIWLVWNQRYPTTCTNLDEQPDYQVSTADDLATLLDALRAGHDPSEWSHLQRFPWD